MKTFLPIIFLIALTAYAQPAAPARLAAEWEPSLGTLIRWPLGIPDVLVQALAKDDSLYVLVANASQEAQAVATFQAWGVNLDNCRFIHVPTNSHWTRDWGPHWIFDEGGTLGIIDPVFDGYPWVPGGPYRGYTDAMLYELDNLVNTALAAEFDCPIYHFPAYLTGGNFMSDGHGKGFSTLAMLTENEAFWSHSEFLGLSGQWLGLDSYFMTVNPENYGIQHIDCSVKLLSEETLLIKQVDPSHPDYARLETINDQLTTAMSVYGREYEIVRIYCDYYSGSDAAAYTNSYILNNKVFVPMFGIPSDAAAIATYQQAMPGYDVIGIPFNAWYYYDALHCRVREIIDPGMLLIWHRPHRGEVSYADQFQVEVETRRYSGADLIMDETEILWRADSGPWQSSPLFASSADSLYGFIPGQPPSTQIDYYITAADQSGRKEALPRPAPGGYFSFTVSGSTSIEEGWLAAVGGVSVHPNPVVTTAVISLAGVPHEPVTVDVYSMDGRLVDSMTISGQPSVHWNASGLKPGCYLIRAVSGGTPVTQRIAVVR